MLHNDLEGSQITEGRWLIVQLMPHSKEAKNPRWRLQFFATDDGGHAVLCFERRPQLVWNRRSAISFWLTAKRHSARGIAVGAHLRSRNYFVNVAKMPTDSIRDPPTVGNIFIDFQDGKQSEAWKCLCLKETFVDYLDQPILLPKEAYFLVSYRKTWFPKSWTGKLVCKSKRFNYQNSCSNAVWSRQRLNSYRNSRDGNEWMLPVKITTSITSPSVVQCWLLTPDRKSCVSCAVHNPRMY